MPGLIHPMADSGWSLSGSILTFAMPMLLFILAATVLYLLFSRPHRIPGHSNLVPALTAHPDSRTAHAMAAAAGLSTAPGAGADPLAHEPAGAPEAAAAAAEDRPAAVHQPGVATAEDGSAAVLQPGPAAAEDGPSGVHRPGADGAQDERATASPDEHAGPSGPDSGAAGPEATE